MSGPTLALLGSVRKDVLGFLCGFMEIDPVSANPTPDSKNSSLSSLERKVGPLTV